MNLTHKLAKNTSIFFVSQIISYILTFFYTIYIARFLGADGYGMLAFALAFSGIFSILADLGLNTLTVREVSKFKNLTRKYFSNILAIKLILAVISFGLIILSINLMGYPQNTIFVVYFIALSVIIASIFGIFYSIFQAYEKMEYQSIGQILVNIIMFLGILIGIYYEFNVIRFSLIYLFSSFIILVYCIIIYIWKFTWPKLDFDKKFWKSNIIEALPFGLTGISVMLYTYIDSVLLSLIQGNEVVGWYNAAYKLVLFLTFIPISINTTIFPAMSKFHISAPNKLKLMNEKYFKFMIIIAIPLGLASTLLAEKIILLIFGTDYVHSIIALQILIWTLIFTFGGASFVRLLEATNRQLILSKITGISVILNIILNLILIPRFSYIGACVATVLTEIFLVTIIFRISSKLGFGINIKRFIGDLVKIIFSSLIMGILIYYLINWNLIIVIILSIGVYLFILFLVKGIDNDDLKIIKDLIT